VLLAADRQSWRPGPAAAAGGYALCVGTVGGTNTCQDFNASVSDLRYTSFGNDTATGLTVYAGGRVAVYSDINWEGTCETFDNRSSSWMPLYERDLSNNTIGTKRISSVWLDHSCDQDIQLCEHNDLGGRCISVRSDKWHLGYTDLGNDTASSIRVPAGASLRLFSDANFIGLVDLFSGPMTRNLGLGYTSAPNDSASSIAVDALPSSNSDPCSSYGCLVQ
jgi:hypothetical protein